MASSNRHWPRMFKSKPCSPHHHHQWQHDINPSSLVSTGCHRSTPPYPSAPGCEERCTPEPKPRWNPKPEQIRILEAIFNSGMVNPPREEIRKIRAQLQEYGQVGDANVFYWFQNRKSRSKHKLRIPQNTKQQQNSQQQTDQTTPPITSLSKTPLTAPSSSSSSSSEKSSPKLSKRTLSLTPPVSIIDLSSSPTGSVNQTYFQAHSDFVSEPFLIPAHQQTGAGGGTMGPFTHGFYFPDLSNVVQVQDHTVGPCTSLLLNEIMNSGASKKHHHEQKNMKMEPLLDYTTSTPSTHAIGLAPLVPAPNTTTDSTIPVLPTFDHVQGLEDHSEGTVLGSGGGGSAATSTVFINDVAFEVGMGPFNVREAFGDDVALIHSSGQPVLTNEWGVTLHSLQHGAFYYLVPLPLSENI